eukprot:13521555-Alexandrium_andersonii.AAC.1
MYKIETDAQTADVFTNHFQDIKRWAAVRDLVLVVFVKGFWRRAVSGGGLSLPALSSASKMPDDAAKKV